jgi:hypothetical protein
MDNVMTSKTNILVLFANQYDMLNEKQQQMTGCTVNYLFYGESGEALTEQSEYDTSKSVGIQRAKCSADASIRAKIPIAPAIYEGTFEMRVGGDGKSVLRLVDVAYICNVDFKPHFIPGLVVSGMKKLNEDDPLYAAYKVAVDASSGNVVKPASDDKKAAK